jgi:hypothetical protein
MSHRNSARMTTQTIQFALARRLVGARALSILVLVLLITNGGAG